MDKKTENLLIKVGIIGVAYFVILKPILNKLGITKSDIDRTIENQENKGNKENPFSPLFYKSAPPKTIMKLLTIATAESYAKQLYDAMGVFGDDESKVYGVFRNLKTQSQLSFLAEIFQRKYKMDLLDYLKRGYSNINPASGLNNDEMNTVLSIVNKLPKYK
jgi:hypothetical protein